MTKIPLLIVDDDSETALLLKEVLGPALVECQISVATCAKRALELQALRQPLVVVQDLCIDDEVGVKSGYCLLRQFLAADAACRVIVLTGYFEARFGVRALEQGAAAFLPKPANVAHLIELIRDGITQAQLRKTTSAPLKSEAPKGIIGSSAAAARLRREVQYLAEGGQSVLLVGPTGVGKSHIAELIHRASGRANAAFVTYQARYSTSDIANSDLFGHRRGAFTGAEEDREGLFQRANGGTLFLDEVDTLPHQLQVALLGVLQNRRFRPIGESKEQETDFRLISALNRPLAEVLEKGALREDLYYRIANEVLCISALSERSEDVLDIAEFYLRAADGKERLELGPRAAAALLAHSWPGNVRELQAAIARGVARARFEQRATISAADLGLSSKQCQTGQSLPERVADYRFRAVKQALFDFEGNKSKAAAALGIDRRQLRRIIEREA